jgi:hypothetical protein
MNLKFCKPSGMPTIVMHIIIPEMRCARAKINPAVSSYKIVNPVVTQPPLACGFGTTLFPNGHNTATPTLIEAKPNGIPSIVIQNIRPSPR